MQELLTESPYTDALTERFHSAVDQLVGPGRWKMTQEMGWWPVNFPGFDDPPYGDDWHIEGGWFHHHVSSPEQALLNLFCFSTVDPGGGGTLVVEGSHHLAARILWETEPEGLEADEFDEPLNTILDQGAGRARSKWRVRRATWCWVTRSYSTPPIRITGPAHGSWPNPPSA